MLFQFLRPSKKKPQEQNQMAIAPLEPTKHPIEREYCYTGQNACQNNKFSETNQQNLEWIENMISLSAYMREMNACINGTKKSNRPEPSTVNGMKCAHHTLFGHVYDWAGQYRECRIAGRGQSHLDTEFVANEMQRLSDSIRKTPLTRKTDAKTIAHELQEFCTQFNYIHPFVNGNGRTQMLLSVQLAKSAGYDLFLTPDDIALFDKARTSMYAGDSSPLEEIIASRLFREDDPSDLHQALKKGVAEKHAELPSEDDLIRGSGNIGYAILIHDPDYPRRRATGRTMPSFIQKIIDKHTEPTEQEGPEP